MHQPSFLSQVWSSLDHWTTWIALSRLRNSFLGRATVALSLSSLVLANLGDIIPLQSLSLLFIGSLVFLLGYALFGFWVSPEFSQPGEIHDHIRRMQDVADDAFVQSRFDLAKRLLEHAEKQMRLRPPKALVDWLSEEVSKLRANYPQHKIIPLGLFHADLSLRQHNAPAKRLIVAVVMGLGALLLTVPMLRNILCVLL